MTNKNQIQLLEAAAFDSFDPDNFDPDFLAGQAMQGIGTQSVQGGSFSLTMRNNAAIPLTIELFNNINSFTKARQAAYAVGNFQYRPWPALTATGPVPGVAVDDIEGTVGFDANGSLIINGAAAESGVVISCNEVPYRALFDQSGLRPFTISKFRMTFTSNAQIDQKLVQFRRSWLGGVRENPVSPRRYFKPDQFQSLIVDVPTDEWQGFDGESGVRYILNAGNTVQMDVFVNVFERTAF